MSRRFARDGGMRRNTRGGGFAPTFQTILGANLAELWDASLGISLVGGFADTWTGQIGTRVMQAPAALQRPVYGADGAHFGGRPVVQCAISGNLGMTGGVFGTPIFLTGSRPYTLLRVRVRTNPLAAGNYRITAGQNSGGAAAYWDCYVDGFTPADNRLRGYVGTGAFLLDPDAMASPTAVHTIEYFMRKSDGAAVLCIDGTDHVTAIGPFTMPNSIVRFSVGCLLGAGQNLDVSLALVLHAVEEPSASQRAAMRLLAARSWP